MKLNIEKAVETYYSKFELSSKDIMDLLECSRTSAAALKKTAYKQQIEDGRKTFFASNVNTESAYKSWGLDIGEIEKKYRKLKSLQNQ